MAPKIGLIGIVMEELKADLWGTLERVAKVGYKGQEGIGGHAVRTGLTPAEVKKRLAALGLDPIASGVRVPAPQAELDKAVALAKDLGVKYIINYWGPVESKDQLLKEAEAFDAFGARCLKEGLSFCYHNHNHEFAKFDGQCALDILLANTDPKHLLLELDIMWATYGGADPAAVIRQYAGRCPILHVKDVVEVPGGAVVNNDRKEVLFTEVGTGVVKLKAAMTAARECGVEWCVVEQDRMRDLAPMDSMQLSYKNLKKALG
jgi:sugar phosphate isomerase/epimerase